LFNIFWRGYIYRHVLLSNAIHLLNKIFFKLNIFVQIQYQTTWSIACHLCKRHYEILTSALAFWTAHLCVHTCPQATLVLKKKSFREITIVEGLIANARFCHGSSRSRFLIYSIYLYRLYCCYSGMNKNKCDTKFILLGK
jgi:hypothetical protein